MSSTDDKIIKMLSSESTMRHGFELLVREYSEPLYWKIRHFVITHEDADDVLQNTFIKVWTNLSQFKGDSKISTWLFRIGINEALDFLRKQKAASNVSADENLGVANQLMADDYFDGDETQAQLQEAIAQLPEVQRTVFNLRYFDEMKYSDMSRMLGTSEGSLKASYHIAVKKITAFFQQHD